MNGAALIQMLGLSPLLPRRPATLSGGEAQRAALARALLSDPKILLMDEPLSALDLGLKQDILPYLDQLRQSTDTPILYVSHDIDEVARLADQIILIEDCKTQAARPWLRPWPVRHLTRGWPGPLLAGSCTPGSKPTTQKIP